MHYAKRHNNKNFKRGRDAKTVEKKLHRQTVQQQICYP